MKTTVRIASILEFKSVYIEGDSQNLRMINGRFETTSGHFFGNYMNILNKTEDQTVTLRC